MDIESSGSCEAEIATVKAALAVTEVVSPAAPPTLAFGTLAVIAVTPLVVPAANCPFPTAVVWATAGLLLPQIALPDRSAVAPVLVVPMAINCAICPVAVNVCVAGTMASET
jgi:hypothetical protein